jgi:poly(A) polymerase
VIVVREDGEEFQIATFRSDGAYRDGRHPESVEFTNAEGDARRRDFTVNGLFYDPIAQRVLDFVGGETDLRAKILRCIGEPDARFNEDKLRLIRCVRFAASLGFEIDPATWDALRRRKKLVITPEWSRRPVHVIDLAVQSAKKGRTLPAKYH